MEQAPAVGETEHISGHPLASSNSDHSLFASLNCAGPCTLVVLEAIHARRILQCSTVLRSKSALLLALILRITNFQLDQF